MKRLIVMLLVLSFAFGASAQKLIWRADEILLPGGKIDSLMSDTSFTDATDTDVPTAAAVKAYVHNNAGGSNSFNFNRPVLRVPEQGDTIGGNTYEDYFDFLYFAPPTISLAQSPSTSLIEIGSSQQYTFTATTNNPGSATLSSGSLFVVGSGEELDAYGGGTTGTATIDFTPLQSPVDTFDSYVYQVRATQSWSGGGESGTATSNIRTFRGAYPIFYGVIPETDTATVYADIYGSSLTKDVELEGDKDITFNYAGTDGIAVYGFPASWSDNTIDEILDPNNLNATGGFIRRTDITVTSTGLSDNYTSVPYVFYVAGGPSTYNSATYQFNQQ